MFKTEFLICPLPVLLPCTLLQLSGNSVFVVVQGKNNVIVLDFSPFLPLSERPVGSASEDTQNLTTLPLLPPPAVAS